MIRELSVSEFINMPDDEHLDLLLLMAKDRLYEPARIIRMAIDQADGDAATWNELTSALGRFVHQIEAEIVGSATAIEYSAQIDGGSTWVACHSHPCGSRYFSE